MFKKFFILACASTLMININSQSMIYKNPKAPIDERVKDLVSRMTIEEKILQLTQSVLGNNDNANNNETQARTSNPGTGSFIYFGTDPVLRNTMQERALKETRLGIPVLFGYDVIHGFRTVFPIPLAQSCTWNPAMVTEACKAAAYEAKNAGIDWTFSPMIDISRDARWGRIAECYGEDPYTMSVFGVAAVRGYQGRSLSDSFSIAACLKHYVGYGASESGRDYVYTEISRQSLWDTYLVPYEACVKAGAATLMSAFNDISGTPASANYYTLTGVLKEKWGHKGFVVSDWDAVKQIIWQGYAKDEKEAGLKAFTAGVEMDMVDNIYLNNFQELLKEGKITMAQIDEAVSRVLWVKFQLGLFEKPVTPNLPENKRILLESSKKLALQIAEQSIVLLKNNNKTLPLSTGKKVAFIGPLVKDNEDVMGSWSGQGQAKDMESIFDGLQKVIAGKSEILYAKGCDFEGDDKSGFSEAVDVAQKADIVVLCIGEKRWWSGENASRANIALPQIQEQLVMDIKKTGKPLVLVLSNGRPLELVRIEPLADAILEIWQPGIATGTAVANILSGKTNPSGKLSVSYPLTTGQVPCYYNKRHNARLGTQGLYQDQSSDPLYPFAYGLSYTDFNYGTISLSKNSLNKNQTLVAEVDVTNTGDMDGFETVHWFINDPYASITRPLKELKNFEKKFIKKGETVKFKFEIEPARDLSFPDETGARRLENGDFYLIVKDQKVKFELVD